MAAVFYRSASTADSGGGATVVIAKPTGLTLGDLMIAQLASDGGIPAILSGWTLLRTDGDQTLYWKIAASGDVAAANFTWTYSGSVNATGGIACWSGTDQTAPIDQTNGKDNGTSAGMSLTTLTPTRAQGSWAIFTYHRSASTLTVSGYAMVTSNPTWTEAYDTDRSFGGNDYGVSMASSTRDVITATGTLSATLSGSPTRSAVAALNIIPPVLTTATVASTGIPPTAIRLVLTVTASLISSAISPTVTTIVNKWKTLAKSVSTWVNTPKS